MNNGDLKLEWDPPDDEEIVSKYIISVSSDWDGGGRVASYESERTSYVLADAFLCTTYTFLVTPKSHSEHSFRGATLVARTRDVGECLE